MLSGVQTMRLRVSISVPWLIISLVFSVVVMVSSFVVVLYIADSGNLGGDGGLLSWCIKLLGHGVRLSLGLNLSGARGVADVVQCAILTLIFYLLGSRWERRRRSSSKRALLDLGMLPPDVGAQLWTCPACGATTPNRSYKCDSCGHSIV